MSIKLKEKCVDCGVYIDTEEAIFCDCGDGPFCSLECLKEHKKTYKKGV
jgi:hypothetical protein